MKDSSSTDNQNKSEAAVLESFMQRALELGVTNMHELGQLIPDAGVQEALIRAEDVNPLRGRPTSVEDLVMEMNARVVAEPKDKDRGGKA